MISTTDVGPILAKCAAYSPDKTPRMTDSTILAWHEHFSDFPHLDLRDALEAVKVYHRDARDRMIQPADISSIARAVLRDRSDRESEVERRQREELLDAKAEGRTAAIARFTSGFQNA